MTALSNILRTAALLVAIFGSCVLLTARVAHAATFTVDRNDDPDPTALAIQC